MGKRVEIFGTKEMESAYTSRGCTVQKKAAALVHDGERGVVTEVSKGDGQEATLLACAPQLTATPPLSVSP